MTNRLMGCAALVVLTGAMTGAANAELITNGGFDTDLSGWTIDGATDTGVTWDSGTAHVGRTGTPGDAVFYQDLALPLGARSLVVGFDYQWQITQPELTDFFTAELLYNNAAGDEVVETLVTEDSTEGAFGTTISFLEQFALGSLSSTTPNGRIRFMLNENNPNQGTRIELDNVSVTAVPAPGTLALLGLGLIGLAGGSAAARRG